MPISGKLYPEAFKIEVVKQVVDHGYFVSSVVILPSNSGHAAK
ncbi:transposase [Escherichia coli]|nr:transposase [Escherichia coli]EEV2831959.1 transposase [Escherichia coli O91:H21]EFX7252771.1 transposase [Shigella sonnei]KDV43167.1 transposase [Escherichia coli O91:H21 str. 2009C-3740]EER0799411.1 transposase [Escherichia coli]